MKKKRNALKISGLFFSRTLKSFSTNFNLDDHVCQEEDVQFWPLAVPRRMQPQKHWQIQARQMPKRDRPTPCPVHGQGFA